MRSRLEGEPESEPNSSRGLEDLRLFVSSVRLDLLVNWVSVYVHACLNLVVDQGHYSLRRNSTVEERPIEVHFITDRNSERSEVATLKDMVGNGFE